MPTFQHHPDNLIIIRAIVQSGLEVYIDTPENFNLDGGYSYVFAGKERLYEPNQRHFVDNLPQPLVWNEGDEYIANITSLLAAQKLRLNPPLTLPELKVVAHQAAKDRARSEIIELDNDLDWGETGTFVLLIEPYQFLLAGRPANPNPNQYYLANIWKDSRNETLFQTLSWMADKYLAYRVNEGNVIRVWNNIKGAINNAATIEDVQAIIDGL